MPLDNPARLLLLAERERATARAADLAEELAAIVASQSTDNIDDEHDAEGATVGFERARVIALLASARAAIEEMNRALGRIDQGEYGSCESCGQAVASERLEALPTTRTCVSCAGKG